MGKKIVYYFDSRGNQPVKKFINSLDKKTKAKVLARLVDMGENWQEYNKRPYIDHLEGGLYEIRIQFAKKRIRVLYAYMVEDYVVLLHGLFKNTSRITESDKHSAGKRLIDFQSRYSDGKIKLR